MSTRRDFLRQGLILVSAGFAVPAFLARSAYATPLPSASASSASRHTLLVVLLAGGNGGLNPFIPFGCPLYRQRRPALAIPPGEVLALDAAVGLHPGLAPLKARFDPGQLAVVRGVGYPNPDRSHFRSMDIWQTADP